MRKLCGVLIAGVIILTFACKSENDVLATYKDGNVTRGNLYEWIEARKLGKKGILEKKSRQKSKLKNIVVGRLAALEAQKNGYDKSDDFKRMMMLKKRNYTAGYLKKKIRKDAAFSEEVVKVRLIKLLVKDFKMEKNKRIKLKSRELEQRFSEKEKEAREIIKQISEGADFAEIAKLKSQDYSKKKGGDIGFIARNMKGPEFSQSAFSLKEGAYTTDPVRIRNGIYILKAEKKTVITDKNIGDVIDDEAQVKRMKRRLLVNNSRKLIDKLAKSEDVVQSFDKVGSRNKSSVLFKIGSMQFTLGQLNSTIDFIYSKRARPGQKMKQIDDKRKKSYAERIFREELLEREVLKKGLDKDPEFIKEWNFYKALNLANGYKNDVVLSGIKVTKEEVRSDYQKNKDKMYTKRLKKGKKTTNKVRPFSEVKDRIEYMLLSRKKASEKRKWERKILSDNQLRIDESKLEGK